MNKSLPRRCVDSLIECDKLILNNLGIELKEVKEGSVNLSMRVTEGMVTSQNLCHGGLVFALADLACAYAVASLDVAPITTEANISFVSAAKLGDTLSAQASIEHHGRKVIYGTVRILNEHGQLVAIYRGSNISRGPVQSDNR